MLQLYSTLVPWSTLLPAVTPGEMIAPLLIDAAVHSLKQKRITNVETTNFVRQNGGTYYRNFCFDVL